MAIHKGVRCERVPEGMAQDCHLDVFGLQRARPYVWMGFFLNYE